MPADLDQFGGDNSHGAVICGEGLVQLRHYTTDGGGFFDQINIEARFCQIQCGLHAGDTCSHNHHRSYRIVLTHDSCLLLPEWLIIRSIVWWQLVFRVGNKLARLNKSERSSSTCYQLSPIPLCELCYMPQRVLQCQEKCSNPYMGIP